MESNKDYLTTIETAKLLGVSVRTVQLWVESGSLDAWKTAGGHRRIRTESVQEKLRQQDPDFQAPTKMQSSHRKRILIVEDNPTVSTFYKAAIDSWKLPIDISTAADGFSGLIKIGQEAPDLIISDIYMPGMDGFTFCQKVHRFSDLPIILLSAEENESVVVEGLKQYAEDYIIKPKSGPLRAEELKARVFSVLSRVGSFGYSLEPIVTVDGRLQVDFAARQAFVAGERVKLTPTEAQLLHILMHHAGRTLPFDYLLRRIWPLEDVFE